MAQTVNFDFAPVGGYENVKTKLWSYGVTPMLTWDIGGDWEAVARAGVALGHTHLTQLGIKMLVV